jgi:cellulose synthase/poly-beta-1,6-N-acetylglucosamine synthase-like glycosyltransferase
VAVFGVAQVLLLGYSTHRLVTLWRWARRARPKATGLRIAGSAPAVTVQLPIFNEREVADRLIDAAACLDYPASLLQIQVLDDSTDDTTDRACRRAHDWTGRGVNIELLHRDDRAGFKAGALAAGLERAKGEIIVVFDADFVPAPDYLRRILPAFEDPGVGMVQARWGHLNRDRSALTIGQAAMLDAHFLLEHEARMAAGLFFNFNGTAGAWRRRCIEEAGGWAHDTLTEDLDLSYRAQLAGWRFVSAAGVEVPSELPSDVLALKSQQRRWAKGSIQTARKILPELLRRRLPLRVKLEATLHLTANAAYPLLLFSALLLPAVIAVPSSLPPAIAQALDFTAIAAGVLPVTAFLMVGQYAIGPTRGRAGRALLSALLVGAGLTLNNSLAVLSGLGRDLGAWERTPKTGESSTGSGSQAYRPGSTDLALAELGLALLFSALAIIAWRSGHPRSAPFLMLMSAGLGYIGWLSLLARIRWQRPMPAVRAVDRLGGRA